MNIRYDREGPERGEGLGSRVRRFVDSELSRVLDKENREPDAPAYDHETPAYDHEAPAYSPDAPAHGHEAPAYGHETSAYGPSPRVEETGPERSPRRSEDLVAERVGLLNDPAGLRNQWQQVQITFVDDPQRAVQEASVLVDRTLQEIRENVTHGQVEDPTSTEELRMSFQRYREFFQRLLSA